MNVIALDSLGYFCRDDRRIVPVGFNYWPASSGVEMWRQWSPAEIRHDLDVIAEHGFNAVRFFTRWQDFEPAAGEYDPRQFDRLADFMGWCRQRGLLAHPSLFVGWMSGGISWPSWREGRNLYADPFMLRRSVEFARRAASAIAPFADCLLAFDLGNELDCLPDSSQAPPAAVAEWCRQVTSAIREACPHSLILSGTSHQLVVGDTGWRLGNQPGCDLYSMHSYPVAPWHPMKLDGLTDPFVQSMLPGYIRIARAFGPVFMQEFGTINCGARQKDAYLRAMLPAAWRAGANGFLFWCLRDITAAGEPYLSNGFEGTVGMFDARDRIKPGLEYFAEFSRWCRAANPPALPAGAVGLYFPSQYYDRDIASAHNHPHVLASRMLLAQHALQRIGRPVKVVRGPIDPDSPAGTLLISGAVLSLPEADRLAKWVEHGGRVLWHGPDPFNWGAAYDRLLGASPADYRAPSPARLELFGQTWDATAYPRDIRLEVELTPAAKALAADIHKNQVHAWRHDLGAGRVIATVSIPEDTMIRLSGQPQPRDVWIGWFAGMLGLLENGAAG